MATLIISNSDKNAEIYAPHCNGGFSCELSGIAIENTPCGSVGAGYNRSTCYISSIEIPNGKIIDSYYNREEQLSFVVIWDGKKILCFERYNGNPRNQGFGSLAELKEGSHPHYKINTLINRVNNPILGYNFKPTSPALAAFEKLKAFVPTFQPQY